MDTEGRKGRDNIHHLNAFKVVIRATTFLYQINMFLCFYTTILNTNVIDYYWLLLDAAFLDILPDTSSFTTISLLIRRFGAARAKTRVKTSKTTKRY